MNAKTLTSGHRSGLKPALLLLFACFACFVGLSLSAAERPNLILFLSDDHGVDFAGCYGNAAIHTPNMDRLAREGMRFTRVFAASPTCSPSRAALYTGLYPSRNGTMGNHTDSRPGLKSLPHFLRALGYRVVIANKADVRQKEVFDFELLNATLPRNPAMNRRYRAEGLDAKKVDEFLAAHAKERPNQPLCLVLGDSCPHVVWEPNRDYDPAKLPLLPITVDTPKTRAALANYYQDITTCDRHLGDVLASLKRHCFETNTLFIYTSDQGPEWPHCKWTCYDTGLRVPFLARWPGVVKPGATSDALISFVDVLPTFIELAGGKAPSELDGRSFRSVLLGEKKAHRDFIFASHTGDGEMNVFPQRCVRDARFKFVLNLKPENQWTTHFTKVMDIPGSHGDVYATWLAKAKTDAATARFIATLERHPAEELYDTESDPYELNNLAGQPEQRERLARLRAQLRDWLRQQTDNEALAVIKP
ncbi:MAG: sulfatase [Verrucomicrobia bacterium]|nr:sulfatase [Verrucomicrobiota bacterium]